MKQDINEKYRHQSLKETTACIKLHNATKEAEWVFIYICCMPCGLGMILQLYRCAVHDSVTPEKWGVCDMKLSQ